MDKRIKSILSSSAKRRNLLRAKGFSTHCAAASLDSLGQYHSDGYLSIEKFHQNIGKLFPLVLSLVSEGKGIRAIERLMSMKTRSLENFLVLYPSFDKAVAEAKKIRRDSIALKAMLE